MRHLLLSSLLLVGCGSKKEEAAPGAGVTEPAKSPAKAAAPVADDLGSCTIRGTGAVTFEQTTPGGRASINVWHWAKEDERHNVAAFILNCAAKDTRITFTAKQQTVEALPAFGPKQYVLGGDKRELNVIGQIQNELFMQIAGTLDITAFDATHIAGTFELTGKRKGEPATVTGTFDYRCPGFSLCAK